jgi:hypothetical protein
MKTGKWSESQKSDTSIPGTFEEWGDLPDEREEKSPGMCELIADISAGKSTAQIVMSNPKFGFRVKDIDALRQALRAEKYMAENRAVKVDYLFGKTGSGILDEDLLISALKSVIDEMNIRRNVLQSEDMPNIFEYNRIFGFRYNHIIVAVDEVGELLDKTGAPKDRREAISTIENCLSTIARQGRAFGINLILGTQRPDANILSGQIKNNIDCRICGRADNVLSQIVLDTTDANDLIPKDSRGRFLMNDGTIFQGYLFEDNEF